MPLLSTSSLPKLFQPIRIGTTNQQHRVVSVLHGILPCRCAAQHVHGPLALEHFKQRWGIPGTLAITEGTIIAEKAGGYRNVPDIWSDEQIEGWLPMVYAVHKNGSFIFSKLQAVGHTTSPDVLRRGGTILPPPPPPLTFPKLPKSTKTHPLRHLPRALMVEEIGEYLRLYASAARNAVLGAWLDSVEIHAANGYLPDQFLLTNSTVMSGRICPAARWRIAPASCFR
ncbi:NADH:flavin oxidoreductase/NADH oxidase [Russula ochroleuca]|uniref:NADH:flavin oxidoreductase/NADH oxidase n=1 Tax=Russula ochroleuca TaxID=152965 RepID=A0A9P5TEN5_9AGAM|nr:NADH:flavin oxidoreductase/NADH oxidase [Russula ochroleuca]